MISRLPIRARVTIAFAAAMAVVLAGVGIFLYLELRSSLDESVDDSLETRAADLTAAVLGAGENGGSAVLSRSEEDDDAFAELYNVGGAVVSSSLGDAGFLEPAEIEAAAEGQIEIERGDVAGVDDAARVVAFPIEVGGQSVIGVVGESLEDRDEALESLARLLAIGLPVALALASLAGYLALGAALRPVEEMRRRAAEISDASAGERLPVPAADDELRRLGETLNAMLARLEAALERERRFVDDASHELRTPLTLHMTELELALRQAEGEGELRAAIASGLEEVERLVRLAEDLLIVARSGEDGLVLNRERLAVGELLARVAERFRTRADEAGRAIAVDPGPAGLAVEADRARIEQALTNLVDNALRYGAGEIRLSPRASGAGVELHVTDAGEGFPPGFLNRALERFSRADAARTRGGAGLGLAIVDAIARAHGGAAGVASPPQGGGDAWISLP